MTTVRLAHLHDQGIDFAVFDADASSRQRSDRSALLHRLTARARASGLSVDKSALAFETGGHVEFFGTPDLVRYLASGGVPRWTHTLTL